MKAQYQLNFDSLPLYGRAAEIDALRRAADRVQRLNQPEVFFINGSSGSGKTSLANMLDDESWNRYFVSGKFDSFSRSPYSAIVDALSDLCDQVVASDDVDKVREKLCEALGGEDFIVRKALPRIASIIGSGSDVPEPLCNESFAFSRLMISFRALLQATMATGKAVILLIDDLQWADRESWDLMLSIAADKDLTRLLMIGVYRDTEVSAEMELHISKLSEGCRFQDVHLDNLDVEQLNCLVATVLKTTTSNTMPLSTVVHAKTAGHPHFAIQFMKAAEGMRLITYSTLLFRWEWDLQKIKADTAIAENIVDIFLAKIDALPEDARSALIIGSCLGAKFDALVVETLLLNMELPIAVNCLSREQLTHALELASANGIINRQNGSMVYRFAHDKIHQAFYSLVTENGNGNELHLKIGRVLLMHRKTIQPAQDWLTFLTANQLNLGSHLIHHADDAVELAKLNLEAAKAALNASAYRPASEYLNRGVELSKDCGWSHYKLRLELLTLLAKTDGCLGNFTECHRTVDEVIRNARTIDEMIPVFLVCIDSLSAEGRIDECLEQGFGILNRLGVKLPRRVTKLTVIFSMMKAKRLLRGKSDAELLSFPSANDPSKIAAVRIINTMVTVAFHARLSYMVGTLVFINTALILKHGFTDQAGSILACYGNLLAFKGEFDEGHRYGLVAMKLAEKSKSGIPRTYMNFYNGLDHLKSPLHQSLEPLLRGYNVGFEVGDTLYGFYCCHFYLSIFFFVGLPLRNLLKDMDSFSKEMEVYNMQTARELLCVHHQSVINLTSETELSDPTLLDGRAMKEAVLLNSDVPQRFESVWFSKLLLGLYFNDYEVIRVYLDKLVFSRPQGIDGTMHFVNVLLWMEAFGAILVAKKTASRKYQNLASKLIKKIEKWVQKGNINVLHFLLHLNAEMAVLKNQSEEKVKSLYESAIVACRRAGFTNTAALANERAALYFLNIGDHEWASYYLRNAGELYDDWGATAKSRQLVRDYGYLLDEGERSMAFPFSGSSSFRQTTSISGRERHSSMLLRTHRGESLELVSDSNSSMDDGSHSTIAKGASGPINSSLGELGNCSMPSMSTTGLESRLPSRIEEAKTDTANEGDPVSGLATNTNTFESSLPAISHEWALANTVIEEVHIDSC